MAALRHGREERGGAPEWEGVGHRDGMERGASGRKSEGVEESVGLGAKGSDVVGTRRVNERVGVF